MGQQIQLFFTDNDLIAFQEYLETHYHCRFFQLFARKKENLEIHDLTELDMPYNLILIWNTDFPWTIETDITETEDPLFYINNYSTGPLFEIDKPNMETDISGRFYWSKTFSSSEPAYDMAAFEVFYKAVIKWVKKNCPGKISTSPGNTVYYMKDAWELKKSSKQ